MSADDNPLPGVASYRTSHLASGYGQRYRDTYTSGYFADQWRRIEEPILRLLLPTANVEQDSDALDIACGTGRICATLAAAGYSVTGADISEAMLELARSTFPTVKFVHGDVTEMNFTARFDLVTCFRFFLNAEAPLRKQVLAACYDTLREDGTLIVNVHVNSTSPTGLAYRVRNRIMRRPVANVLGAPEMRRLLQTAGFVVDQTLFYSFLPRIGWWYPRPYRSLMMPMERFFGYLPATMRAFLAQSYIVVARKSTNLEASHTE